MAGKSSNKRRNAISGEGSPAEISPAADLIASNVDLISEILVRLPAKSLIRFKCVSKQWLSLTSQPQFSTNHSTRNRSLSMSGLYFYSDSRLQSVSLIGNHGLPSLSFIDGIEGNESKPKIIHSCNGLLLFEMFFGTGYKPNSIYIVSNVTTQKYKVLPKPSELSIRIPILRGACLAFDPSKSPHYKVVVGSRYNPSLRDPWRVEIDLYNSESGNWKKILPPGTCYGRGVFMNGAIHWLSLQDGLLRFEVDAEEMIALPLPRGSNISKKSVKYFGECGDGLILIQTRSSSTMRCTTLELEGRTCRLISKYWVDLKTMGPAFPEMETFSKFYVLCVVKDEKKEDLTLVVAIPGKVITYNMKSKTLGLLRDLVPGEVINDGVNGCAYPFIETLCPV